MDFYFYTHFLSIIYCETVTRHTVSERQRKTKSVKEASAWKWKVGNINTYLVSGLFLNDLLIVRAPAHTKRADTYSHLRDGTTAPTKKEIL